MIRNLGCAATRALLHRYPLTRGRSRITSRLRGMAAGQPVVVGPEGTRVKLDLSQVPSQQWFWFGSWEPGDMAILRRHIRPGAITLDVGANIGLFTLAMAQLVGQTGAVHAFEPDPRNHALLEENIALNDLGGRVVVRRAALSDEAGVAFLDSSGDAASAHMTGAGVAVDAIRLDDHPLPRLDFVKIDVEGVECRVLRGASGTLERFRPLMLVECAERHLRRAGASLDELRALLEELGYRSVDESGSELARLPANANVLCVPR